MNSHLYRQVDISFRQFVFTSVGSIREAIILNAHDRPSAYKFLIICFYKWMILTHIFTCVNSFLFLYHNHVFTRDHLCSCVLLQNAYKGKLNHCDHIMTQGVGSAQRLLKGTANGDTRGGTKNQFP